MDEIWCKLLTGKAYRNQNKQDTEWGVQDLEEISAITVPAYLNFQALIYNSVW